MLCCLRSEAPSDGFSWLRPPAFLRGPRDLAALPGRCKRTRARGRESRVWAKKLTQWVLWEVSAVLKHDQHPKT